MRHSRFSGELEIPAYNFSPLKITKFLLTIITFLVLFNIAERGLVRWLNAVNGTQLISHYFNFDQESNFPSIYSALALGFCSYLLTIIASLKKINRARFANHWKALSLIFLFLAIDEACSIHELFIPFLRSGINAKGIFYFTWVIPAFLLLIVFLITFRKFIHNLPAKTKTLFVTAGIIYVGGALGMELVGGYIADNFGYNTVYGIASSIEEILEMLGVVIFINGLLSYIQSQSKQVRFSISFDSTYNKS